MKAQIIEVIRVECVMGYGTKDDPVRTAVGYFSKDGQLIAEMDINDDPCSPYRIAPAGNLRTDRRGMELGHSLKATAEQLIEALANELGTVNIPTTTGAVDSARIERDPSVS